MSSAAGITAFIVMLILAIVVHEAAHFSFAKVFGFKVEEFFVGFGPRLWSTRRGETEYGLKAIPAGGYVKIAGMNPFQPTPAEDLPRSYGAKPIWQRAIVIVAGPLTHFVLAFVFAALALGSLGRAVDNATFAAVASGLGGTPSPAAEAGLRPGDRVVRVAVPGSPPVSNPTVTGFGDYVGLHVGDPITLVVDRDGTRITRTVTPVIARVNGQPQPRIGVVVDGYSEPVGLVGAITGAPGEVARLTTESVRNMARVFGPEGVGRVAELLFTDAPRRPTDAASIVGVSRVAGVVAEEGQLGQLFLMFAFVNIFIGLLNLLPLPPFDGGHLAVLGIEKIRGKQVDMRKLIPVSAVVLTFFVMFTAAVVFLDVVKPLELSP